MSSSNQNINPKEITIVEYVIRGKKSIEQSVNINLEDCSGIFISHRVNGKKIIIDGLHDEWLLLDCNDEHSKKLEKFIEKLPEDIESYGTEFKIEIIPGSNPRRYRIVTWDGKIPIIDSFNYSDYQEVINDISNSIFDEELK